MASSNTPPLLLSHCTQASAGEEDNMIVVPIWAAGDDTDCVLSTLVNALLKVGIFTSSS